MKLKKNTLFYNSILFNISSIFLHLKLELDHPFHSNWNFLSKYFINKSLRINWYFTISQPDRIIESIDISLYLSLIELLNSNPFYCVFVLTSSQWNTFCATYFYCVSDFISNWFRQAISKLVTFWKKRHNLPLHNLY